MHNYYFQNQISPDGFPRMSRPSPRQSPKTPFSSRNKFKIQEIFEKKFNRQTTDPALPSCNGRHTGTIFFCIFVFSMTFFFFTLFFCFFSLPLIYFEFLFMTTFITFFVSMHGVSNNLCRDHFAISRSKPS